MLRAVPSAAVELLEAIPDGIVVVDGRGKIIFVNANAAAMFGYPPDEMVGRSIEHLIPASARKTHRGLLSSYMRNPETRPMVAGRDLVARHRDGHEFPTDVSLSPWPAADQVLIITAVRDVTERCRTEETMRANEARLHAIMEHFPFQFWAYDADGRIFLQNAASKAQWGDQVGRIPFESGLPDDLIIGSQSMRRSVMSGQIVQQEERFDPDGERVHLTIAGPIVDGDEISGVMGVAIDVTERHRALQLEIELRAAHESELLKDALLSTVSHELQTPLSVIRGYASTVIDYGDRLTTAEIADYFGDIERQALQLERLVSDLLTLSELEAGVLRMDLQPADIGDVAREAARVIQLTGANSSFTVAQSVPTLKALADAGRIQQVLHNLLDNANKYSPVGTAVAVSIVDIDSDTVGISVRDHGAGVPRGELADIFDRFYRSKESPPGRGVGLGLAICKSIIEAHGGKIWAELPPDGGLMVSFSLRRA